MRSISAVFSVVSGFAVATSFAADIGVVGTFPGKAVLVIEGGSPKTYSVGSVVGDHVKLLAVTDSAATFEDNGKRRTIALGEHINHATPNGHAQVTLEPDGLGHYIAHGQINGGSVTMLVDTGASMISLPASDATRLGINYRNGQRGYVSTANGTAPTYKITLDTVKIGDVQLNQVSALVQETGLPFILLGMSFLNRTDMHSEGGKMIISKRY